jgi:hypothetical protein
MAPDSNTEIGLPPSAGSWSTMAGMRLFGATARKLRLELLALADIDRNDFVFQPGLFEKDRDFVAVRRGPVMHIDHDKPVGG